MSLGERVIDARIAIRGIGRAVIGSDRSYETSLSRTVVRENVLHKLVVMGERAYLDGYSLRRARFLIRSFPDATADEKKRASAILRARVREGEVKHPWWRLWWLAISRGIC